MLINYRFCNYKNIMYHLRAYNRFRYGRKALIYTDRIDTVKDLVEICENVGLRAVGSLSINNTKKQMDDYHNT